MYKRQVQTGIEFTGSMAMEFRDSVMGVGLYRVTANCYSGIRGLFSSLQGSLFLYVPLLTMGLILSLIHIWCLVR